jgi:sugar lactone lactonase YvrE
MTHTSNKLWASLALCACSTPGFGAGPSQIDINDTMVFPESLGSSADGTIYIGGQTSKTVYRVAPRAATAEPWIMPGTGGLLSVFGVLADDRTHTLWVCSVDRTTQTRDATSLMAFDLNSGKPKAKFPYPGGGTCNDVTIAKDGSLYATDTLNGRILRLARDGNALTEVVKDPQLLGADGIVFTPDGKLYTNTYNTGLLLRINLSAKGIAGTITQITTNRPLVQPDGMRLTPKGVLLMVEGQGRLDRVAIAGDSAIITVLHEGYLIPSAVTVVGNTAWELETKFNYQRDPNLRGQDPGVFHAYAVPLSTSDRPR